LAIPGASYVNPGAFLRRLLLPAALVWLSAEPLLLGTLQAQALLPCLGLFNSPTALPMLLCASERLHCYSYLYWGELSLAGADL